MSFDATANAAPDFAISVQGLGKRYEIYDRPSDRLMQMLMRGRRQYFREFWALRDVSFEIRRGDAVGIIGRNGSGKSTLLQLLCGTLNPTEGQIQVNGRVAALLELGAGFNPEFSGRDNVYMAAQLVGLTRAQTDERFDRIAAFADIGDFIEQPVKTYSSGMYVRLAFAVNAHVDADILVIDEALAVGDAVFTQKCMRFIRAFRENGTLLFVSHDTNSVRSLCNSSVWIDKGRVVAKGFPKEICERYLEACYQAQQGTVHFEPSKVVRAVKSERWKDQRAAFINHSNLRNDLKVFEFDPEAASFGNGNARIRDVRLVDADGVGLNWVVGGEPVTLLITIDAVRPVIRPIVGFLLKDARGQPLFGDNTYLTCLELDIEIPAGKPYQAEFSFNMPILPRGDYSFVVSAAAGTQEHHEQLQWIHDALFIKSESSSASTGLIGIPMTRIGLFQIEDSGS
jgi:lipopolysaccharide transport system ATP-binding protein